VAKVTNPTLKGFDWAEVSRSAAQPNDLTADTILLGGEFHSAKGGGSEQWLGARQKRDAAAPNEELNITEGEGSGIGRSTGVLARTKEEEEGKDDHVRNGHHHWISQVAMGVHKLAEDLDGNRLHPSRRGVTALPGSPETGKAKVELAEGV
jgi:hypothetical protein